MRALEEKKNHTIASISLRRSDTADACMGLVAKTLTGMSQTIVSTSMSDGPCHVMLSADECGSSAGAIGRFDVTNSKCNRHFTHTEKFNVIRKTKSIHFSLLVHLFRRRTDVSDERGGGGEWDGNADVRLACVQAKLLVTIV